jgi:hypothetical protein
MKLFLSALWRYALVHKRTIVLVLAGIGIITVILQSPISRPAVYDSSDYPPGHSGVRIHVDALTGCHYLSTSRGGVTPRLNTAGNHICTGAE